MEDVLIPLRSDALSALVNPFGAELWSLKDPAGRELMTDADPAFWTGHAPILFPIVGGLSGDRYRLRDGRTFALPRHGFARRAEFTLADDRQSAALFRLVANEESRAVYPFQFLLDIAYRLEGATLVTEATVVNEGREGMPFSFGFHPAFAWPLPYGAPADAHRIAFEREEPAPLRQLDATGLVRAEPRTSPVVDGRILTPTPALFADDALIWDRLASRALTWGPADGPHLLIRWSDTLPCLGIWQKPDARFLCIEPWAGHADPAGYDGALEDKPGIVMLPPGDARSFRMDVTLIGG